MSVSVSVTEAVLLGCTEKDGIVDCERLRITLVVDVFRCGRLDGAAASSCRKALPGEPTDRCAKVLHGVSLGGITVVLGALVRPGRSTALEARSRLGDNHTQRMRRMRQALIRHGSSEGGE